MARDVAAYIHSELGRLISATKDFKHVFIYIVESDSSDGTLQELKKLQSTIPNFYYSSFGKLSEKILSRTERIAFCRNKVIEEVSHNLTFSHVDFVMMADLDGLNLLIDSQKIKQCWSVHEDWDAIFANQANQYYDIYALRHPEWNSKDCIIQEKRLAPIVGVSLAHFLSVSSRQICLPKKLGLIEVESAFGGFGIYKKAAFLSGKYIGVENGNDICEHVPFHRILRANGFRLFINCALINCEKPSNPNERIKKRPVLTAIKVVGQTILGRSRFNKYLDFLKS